MHNTKILLIFLIVLIVVISLPNGGERHISGCCCSGNCFRRNKYFLKGDNNLFLGENGFVKYPKNDCKTPLRILPVGLGKVAIQFLSNGKFLGKCPDPCEDVTPTLYGYIMPCDIGCNTDGHFTLIENTDGSVLLVSRDGQYLTRCTSCDDKNTDKLVLSPNIISETIFFVEKA